MTKEEIKIMSALALLLLETQQPLKAIKFLRALVVLHKDEDKYIYALAWAHLMANQPEQGMRTLRLLKDKDSELGQMLLVQALAKQGKFEAAKEKIMETLRKE